MSVPQLKSYDSRTKVNLKTLIGVATKNKI